jgi:hypothetical protein
MFDCCHSGGIGHLKGGSIPEFKALPESYYETLNTGVGRVTFASSRSTEFSYILPGASNSLFTRHLLAGLQGGVPGPGGVIRVFDLWDYLQPKVTRDHPNQHPIFRCVIEENFPIALYKGGEIPKYVPESFPKDDFIYDVFISYRQQEPDKNWIRKTLLPRLEAEGLRVCIDYRDFRLGAPIVLEISRAVEQSRYTLSILTPAYLASDFAELATILAEHLGLEKSQRRWLSVLREPCSPRLGMRAKMWLDMSDDEDFEQNVERLIFELNLPPRK